jgi:hypothetical protein
MNPGPDDMARILRGARKCPDSSRDDYFQYVAERLKYFSEPLDQITADAVQLFGEAQTQTPTQTKTKRRRFNEYRKRTERT